MMIYEHYCIHYSGTKNVISVCRESKVKRLIYNSSADVVFDGKHDICNGDESLTYQVRSSYQRLYFPALGLVVC